MPASLLEFVDDLGKHLARWLLDDIISEVVQGGIVLVEDGELGTAAFRPSRDVCCGIDNQGAADGKNEVALVGFLWLFTHYTRIGLALRGMAQDERAALMLGIDSDRMAVVAMVFGAMLAGLASVLLLPLGNIVVETGYNVLILAIAVCIVGGLGSWMGAVLAAFIIGFAQILTEVYLGTHFKVVVALLAIIITLILRPSGLFGQQKELEERV